MIEPSTTPNYEIDLSMHDLGRLLTSRKDGMLQSRKTIIKKGEECFQHEGQPMEWGKGGQIILLLGV